VVAFLVWLGRLSLGLVFFPIDGCCAAVGGGGVVGAVCGWVLWLVGFRAGLLWLASRWSSRVSRLVGGWVGVGGMLALLLLICLVAFVSVLWVLWISAVQCCGVGGL
jgi:hypothetical protein